MDATHPRSSISSPASQLPPSGNDSLHSYHYIQSPALQPTTDLLHTTDETYPCVVVRALYPYQSRETATISLSFQKDDLIQVVAQLESGWWYGFCNDSRGWFPSNFVEEITQAEDDDDSDHDSDDETSSDDLWLPQTTPDGQVYYFNTRTGDSSWSISRPSAAVAATVQTENRAPPAPPPASPASSTTTTATATPPSVISSPSSAPSISNESANTNGSPSSHDPTAPKHTVARENSIASSRSSLAAAAKDVLEQDQTADHARAMSAVHETAESDSHSGSTRPNSWQTSAVPTRAGSPISQDGSNASGNPNAHAALRKPSGASAPGVVADQGQGLPPLPPVSNPFESEPTWSSLSEHTSGTLQNLINSADHGYKPYYQIQAAQVVESVRVMFYASGTIDKDAAPIRLHQGMKVHHRQIMAALSRLVLSAKMASSIWPAEGAVSKMRSDADDVANSVHQFIMTAQSAGITVHDVDAKLILDPEGALDLKSGQKLARTVSSTSRPSFDSGDKSSYRRSLGSAGLLSQLDYYCKSACKAIGLLSLQVSKVLEGSQSLPPPTMQFDSRPLYGASIMNSAQSSQLVAQCHQALSQIGSLLSLVGEYYTKVLADHPLIKDHIFLDVRVSKQALYNNVAALVMAIQLATDPMAQTTVLEMALEAIQTAERSVMDLTAATRSLATENDELEKHSRPRVTSEASSTLIGQSSFHRQSEIDSYFLDQDSDFDAETKSSRHRSVSRQSSFSSNSSISGVSVVTTQGTDYTARSLGTSHPFSSPSLASSMEVNPPGSRPSISLSQKANARGAKLKKMLGEEAPTPQPTKALEVPWYLGHDYSPSDISFNMEGHVRGGTLAALVERLTLHDGLDSNFVATFLLTYRSFASTSQFFSLLFRRITIKPPGGLTATEHSKWTERKLTPIRLRVFNIIKSWLENYYMEDEVEDRQMLPKIKEFSESGLMRESMSFAAVQLIKLVEKREVSDGSFRRMVLNLSTQAPQPITPRNLKKIKFMDLDALEFARQLTIMEANCYNRIKPVECLAKAWTSEDPEMAAKASNIKKMIETSNLYSNWINEVVLSEKELKKRAAIIKHLIAVAERLRQLNNFSMLSATTAALAQSPIHRLKRTWELVPGRIMNMFSTLQGVTSSAKNWGDYRQELHSANPPCVPFVGVYLTDLVMIQDGNPDVLKGTDQHINFYKRVSTAEVIREIQQYQSVPYCLTTVQEIQAYIRRGLDHAKPVQVLYDMSLALEPREGEEEKITRLLSESGFLA